MTETYDCTEDVLAHRAKVRYFMWALAEMIMRWGEVHDSSKLSDPEEKALFDHWTPELRRLTFGSDEYKIALDGMGEGVKRHYKANRHHPEHWPNGINSMTLLDLIEMLCDWMASAQAKKTYVDLDNGAKRFGLSEQLVEIFANTLREWDVWFEIEGVPVPYFCPPDRVDGYVDGFENFKKGR